MEAGALRHRVVIQQNTPSQDSYGDPVAAWSTYATRWGAVEPLTGREYFTAQQFQAAVSVRIRVRWWNNHGVTPKMRVSWSGRIFEIDTVQEVGSGKRELHLMCEEIQP